MTDPNIKQTTVTVQEAKTETWPNLGALRALVAACDGLSDRAGITVTEVAASATYAGELCVPGRLIVRDVTTGDAR